MKLSLALHKTVPMFEMSIVNIGRREKMFYRTDHDTRQACHVQVIRQADDVVAVAHLVAGRVSVNGLKPLQHIHLVRLTKKWSSNFPL